MSEDSSDAETISVEYRESDEESMQVDEQDEETLTESSDAMGPYYEKGEKVFVVLKDKRTSKKGSIHLLPIQPAKVLGVITKKSKTTKGDARPKYSYEVELFETISFTTAVKKGKFEEELLLDMNDDHKKRFDDQKKQKSAPTKKQPTPAKKQSRGSLSKNTSKGSQTSPAYANRLLSFKNEAYMQKPVSQSRKPLKNLKQMIAMEDVSNLPSDTPTYSNITAPPSIRPVKKYCDVTGLRARYTHPRTNIRYATADLYKFVNQLDTPSVNAYLELRKANVVLI